MINWFKTSFAQIGRSATFYYIGDRMLQTAKIGSIYPYVFFSQPLAGDNGKKIRLSKNFPVKEITEQNPDLRALLAPEICRYRFQQQAVCIGAYKEDTLAALLWFTPGVYHEDEVRADFIPPAECCWDFGVHIEPEFRLTRAFSNLWITSSQIMRQRGFTASLSRISAFNPGSLKAHSRMGAALLGKAVFINIGPLQICFSDVKPRFHISLSAGSRAVFHF